MEQMVGNIVLFGFLFLFIYFVMIRPNKRARAEHQRMVDSVQPGDEVMTTGGIFGTVRSVGDEELKLEVAPGTEVRMVKRAIATRVTEDLDDDADASTEERATENA
ncbi:MAG: preprotein translocase subunit YajC [Actinobacteria bacterium]|nr:preprotein translocase subunit YajC [Actinomycetota bacterium]